MTAFAAMFHGTAARFAWGRTEMTSSGARFVCLRNASTRSIVGGMIGSSSVHSRDLKYSLTSSRLPSWTIAFARRDDPDAGTGMALGGWLGGFLFDVSGAHTWSIAAAILTTCLVIPLAERLGLPSAFFLPPCLSLPCRGTRRRLRLALKQW
jgi:hypothetical protein